MIKNFWLGNEELVIVYRNGTHFVFSSWEEEPQFIGSYDACYKYCVLRDIEYRESIIG